MRSFFTAAAVLILASLAYAASDRATTDTDGITGPNEIEPYRFIDFAVKGEYQSATWKVTPKVPSGLRLSNDGMSITFVAPPGTYTVESTMVNWEKRKLGQAEAVVTVKGATPPEPKPEPKPEPGPGPKPTPTQGLVMAIIGDGPSDMRKLTPEQVAMVLSPRVWKFIDGQCLKGEDGWPCRRIISRNHLGNLGTAWQEIVAKVPKQGVVLAMACGDKWHVGELPANDQALIKLAAEFKGVPVPALPPVPAYAVHAITEQEAAELKPALDVNGMPAAKPRNYATHPVGSIPGMPELAVYGVKPIPRSEWPSRIQALKNAGAGLMPLTYDDESYDQKQTNYCWCNCVAQSMSIALRVQNRPFYRLSSASIGGPITGFSNVGGWPAEALKFAIETGAVNEAYWPNTAISASYLNKPEVKADYPKNRVAVAVADLGTDFDQIVTCVLLGAPCPVAYNWWSHAVTAVGVDIENGEYFLILRNSWGNSYGDRGFFKLPKAKQNPNDAQAVLHMLAA